jgi:hypothetical protein
MSADAKKKPVASEGKSESEFELKKYNELMREMDSPDGIWNPEPDGHITGTLREDVSLSPTDTKTLAYVKSCCTRMKRLSAKGAPPPYEGDRTAWGRTGDGKPLTVQRVADFFEWDRSNALKSVNRLVAYGFIRQNKAGILGLGARVTGILKEEGGEGKENECGLYKPLPKYLLTHLKGLSGAEAESFPAKWDAIETWAEAAHAQAKSFIYQAKIARQDLLCQSVGTQLQKGGGPSPDPAAQAKKKPIVQLTFLDEPEWFVQTTSQPEGEEFVQTPEASSYEPPPESVPTTHIRNQKTEHSNSSTAASSSSEDSAQSGTTTGFSVVEEALKAVVAEPLPDDARQLAKACRKEAKCEPEEIAFVIEHLASDARAARKPMGFLMRVVPRYFAGDYKPRMAALKPQARARGEDFISKTMEEFKLQTLKDLGLLTQKAAH